MVGITGPMKSDHPITSFLTTMNTFRANDIAIMFELLALRETAIEMRGQKVISPAIQDRMIFCHDLTKEQLKESLARLVEAGELEWYSDGVVQGYLVSRFDEFEQALIRFGARKYQRIKTKEYRIRRERKLLYAQ